MSFEMLKSTPKWSIHSTEICARYCKQCHTLICAWCDSLGKHKREKKKRKEREHISRKRKESRIGVKLYRINQSIMMRRLEYYILTVLLSIKHFLPPATLDMCSLRFGVYFYPKNHIMRRLEYYIAYNIMHIFLWNVLIT